jgi:hypothetical protein
VQFAAQVSVSVTDHRSTLLVRYFSPLYFALNRTVGTQLDQYKDE